MKNIELKPRHRDFDFEGIPRHWHADAFKTHFFNALQTVFPDGERFFIDSVRHYRDEIKDPELKEQIKGFIGQEAIHSREHIKYNEYLGSLGYDLEVLAGGIRKRLDFLRRRFPAHRLLASTTSLEHLTALLAHGLLSNPRWLEGADERMANLWRWHLREEIEHKAVAFDVYQTVHGSKGLLRWTLVVATMFLTINTMKGTMHMLKKDGLLWNGKLWWAGLKWMWGKEGILRPLLPLYFAYLKRDFHPWKHDDSDLLKQFKD